jgi:hypothetical protein
LKLQLGKLQQGYDIVGPDRQCGVQRVDRGGRQTRIPVGFGAPQ